MNDMDNDSNSQKSQETVLFSKTEHIATITINRPKKMNALRMKEFEYLIKYMKKADSDPEVHVIRINSSGDQAFTGGLDLNMLTQLPPEEVPKLLQHGNNTVWTMLRSKKPIVVQVQGPAVAWGTILCLAADFVIAGENPKTFFSLNEIDLGIVPATGALTLALFNFGLRQAKKITMIPERISIEKAEQFGLVSQRCTIDDLEQGTLDFCHNLVEKPQAVLIPIKALLNNFLLSNMAYYFEKEAEAVELSLEGDLTKFDEFIEKLWNTNL
ncbi:MAG: enoyl-CoA hydratase/isomerase family protein [Candidatus Hodarchaeales archaeon]|jgi:enoyl-CoA hydratase/carnithine racemase